MAAAMNDDTDELSQRIDERLAEIVQHIADTRDAFASIALHVDWTVEARLEQVRSRTSARCAQFQSERDRVNSRVKKVLANAKLKVDVWKKSGQTQMLRLYAHQSEQYALATILDANDAIDRALIAAMESVMARLIADRAARKW